MLALPLGVNVRQLQNYMKELENYTRGDPPEPFRLIEVTRVWVEKEGKTRNIYSLLWHPFLLVNLKANGAGEATWLTGATRTCHLAIRKPHAPSRFPCIPAQPFWPIRSRVWA